MAEITHEYRTDDEVVTTPPPPPPPPPPPADRPREVAREVRRGTVERTRSLGRGTARMVVTALGITGMILGSFLNWTGGRTGVEIPVESYYRTGLDGTTTFLTSAGAVTIGLGILALIGIAMLGGWLIRIAGALGMAAFVLMLVTIGRTDGGSIPADVQIGLWIVLAGSVVTVIAGFMPTTRVVQIPESEIVTNEHR